MPNFFPVKRVPGVTAKARKKPGEMSKAEEAYSGLLETRYKAGEIAWYAYEAVKLRLADATFFSPDFVVMLADGTVEIHEVKGYKKMPKDTHGFWAEEDAKIKLKIAAELFPFQFVVVFQLPKKCGSTWGEWRP